MILKSRDGVEKLSLMEIHLKDILRMDCLMAKVLIFGLMALNMKVNFDKDIEMVEVF